MTERDKQTSSSSVSSSDSETEQQLVVTECKKEPEPNGLCIFSIAVVMSGTLMFGADTTLFGAIQSVEAFVDAHCVDKYGSAMECGRAGCDWQLVNDPLCSDITSADACCAAIRSNLSGWVDEFLMLGNFLLFFGAAWGALLLGPFVSRKFGRRIPVVVGCCIAIVGCLFQSYLSFHSNELFLAARFVLGFGAGVALCVLPTYNSEVAVPKWRGITGGLFQLFIVCSGFIAVLICRWVTDHNVLLMIPAFFAIPPAVGVLFIPESPRFLMDKHGYEKGLATLQKIRKGDATEEAKLMWNTISQERNTVKMSMKKLLTTPNTRKRLFVAVMFQIVQQFSGVNMILGYFGTLMAKIAPDFNPFSANLIYQSCFIVGSLMGVTSLDLKFGGRRRQTLVGLTICTVAFAIAAIPLAASSESAAGYVALAGIFIFGFGFQISIGIIAWLYPSEIFTLEERDNAMAITVWTQYIMSAVIVVISPPMTAWSVYGTFFIFMVMNMLWTAWAWMFVKETRNVTLENVCLLFQSKK